jgi:hypothetical protein
MRSSYGNNREGNGGYAVLFFRMYLHGCGSGGADAPIFVGIMLNMGLQYNG